MAEATRDEAGELLSDLIQLTALREAVDGNFYGSRLIEDFANRGYCLSPGTVYPMLHALERKGYLVSRRQQGGNRRLYRTTEIGRRVLNISCLQFRPLFMAKADFHGEPVAERRPSSSVRPEQSSSPPR